MKKGQSSFSLIEILLAVSAFGLITIALVGGFIYGQQTTAVAGMRSRATILADEGLEAVRNIRDAGFSNLTDGPHGLTISNNQWTLSGTSDTTENIFTRTLTISPVNENRKQVTSTVTWLQTPPRSGTVALTTYLTNWKKSKPVSTCDIYCQSLGTYTTGTCRENEDKCEENGEVYESGGDEYCAGTGGENSCCCLP